MDRLASYLMEIVQQVRDNLNLEPLPKQGPQLRFADLLDSMGMVEFLLCVARSCECKPEQIEECVQRRFGSVAELAQAMSAAALFPKTMAQTLPASAVPPPLGPPAPARWITATACSLGDLVEPAAAVDSRLGRPSGWLEEHAGILQRRRWQVVEPVSAAVDAACRCLHDAGIAAEDVGGLLVTSEAPPLVPGLAAALHHRLGLSPDVAALEIGNACTGFLTALWLAARLPLAREHCLVIAVEAPSRYLRIEPGPAGEAAALFGDAAAACLLSTQGGPRALALNEVMLATDGSGESLIQVAAASRGHVELHLQGRALATRALDAMADATLTLVKKHGLAVGDLSAVVMHGGNGRMPALLARRLGLPAERVLSQTILSGNLGSASVPVAWAQHKNRLPGPVIWTAVGAGLQWGAALLDQA